MAQPPPGDPLAGLFGLLVGHQWPGRAAVTSTLSASAARAATGASHDDYADVLQSIRGLALRSQRGVTAENIEASFGAGEHHIREIAERNRTKAGAYDCAHRSASQLRRDLTDIARRGEADIREIARSAAPVEQRISAIADVVAECQGLANGKAAQQAGSILNAIQNVLDAEGSAVSARQLARQGGVELHTAFTSRSTDEIRSRVTSLLEDSTAAPATAAPGAIEAAPSVSPGSETGIGGVGTGGPSVPATGAGARAADNTGHRAGVSASGHLPWPRPASLLPDAPSAPTPGTGTAHAVVAAPPDPAPTPAGAVAGVV
ncbi:MAG: hypothetical protein ACKOQ4_17445, partial [Mycobacterium sp.]